MAIPQVAINRMATTIVPTAGAEGAAAISGLIKLLARFGPGGRMFAGETAMILTRAEQSAIFAGGRRLLFKFAGGLFLVGAILDLARGLIVGNEERRPLATRLEIIQAHIIKGGPILTRALGVAEQLAMIVLDDLGATVGDVLAGVLANVDEANNAPPLFATIFDRQVYAELATPAADLDSYDSVIEAPGLFINPGLVKLRSEGAVTFPSGPRPTIGRRS